jgi:hypothetical protein
MKIYYTGKIRFECKKKFVVCIVQREVWENKLSIHTDLCLFS